ncbi:hypothetical protein ACOMHN_023524 [Nucella lapillus]
MELAEMNSEGPPSTKMTPDQDIGDGGESVVSQASWGDFKPMMTQMDRLLDEQYRHRNTKRVTMQVKVYNFLERPTGWKCFIYHFTV